MSTKTNEVVRAFSGIYPHLAVTNDGRAECGIGAIVPWADNLWFVTYTAHAPAGSEDRLYRLDPALLREPFAGSVGGTHANRMIHEESGQLSIGPYFIDQAGTVRALPLKEMPGRMTTTMRHLSEPEQKVYLFGMEGELYEVDVASLKHRQLDGPHPVAGSHAKGGYTADGRITVSNNGEWGWYDRWQADHTFDGETGALAEWDGEQWTVIERRQYTEVMGPGGLSGKAAPGDPLWATGWDKKSALLSVRQDDTWHTLRLPKGSYTYDGGHGWHTEWPRIRQLEETNRWLMTLHGMMYEFPPTFTAEQRHGIRPIATYHKMIVDFCQWNGQIVLACNDASMFDNPLLGRCQSNLWWVTMQDIEALGIPHGWGGMWLNDDVAAGTTSDPMFIGGFTNQTLHVRTDSATPQQFELEVDQGDGQWRLAERFEVVGGYATQVLNSRTRGQWARLRSSTDAKAVTAYWHLGNVREPAYYTRHEPLFKALPAASVDQQFVGGIIRPTEEPDLSLQYIACRESPQKTLERLHYRVNEQMQIERVDEPERLQQFEQELGGRITQPDFEVDAASVIIREGEQAYRLPKADPAYEQQWPTGYPRGRREVVTERSLWNLGGTFYELPRESSGGVRRMKPICTHGRMITDFCSWRGMLVLAGHCPEAESDDHFVRSVDGQTGLWFGVVDDLWKFGKPRGYGGPWRDTSVEQGQASDPYMMTGFDQKTLTLSHDGEETVRFGIEIDFLGDGSWSVLDTVEVAKGQRREYAFTDGFSAHWVRLRSEGQCVVTAWFEYQ